MRMEPGESAIDHINRFPELWEKISQRWSRSTNSLAKEMKETFTSEDVEGQFFPASLPGADIYRNKIDNLVTKEDRAYGKVETAFLDETADPVKLAR